MQTKVFGRTKAHREAMLRNLSRSLVLDEKIMTTEPRAKEVRRIVDRWLTLAKRVATSKDATRLGLYRRLLTNVHDPKTARKLVDDLAVRSKDRISGFVTLARVQPRVGDAAPRQQLRLVDQAAAAPAVKVKTTPVAAVETKKAK